MSPIFSPNDILWANLAFSIPLMVGIFGSGLVVAYAIWFGYAGRIRDFLTDSKRSQVDEKIAVIYGHASSVSSWDIRSIHFILKRILSDIRSP